MNNLAGSVLPVVLEHSKRQGYEQQPKQWACPISTMDDIKSIHRPSGYDTVCDGLLNIHNKQEVF